MTSIHNEVLLWVLVFFIGLAVGSFLNVVIERLKRRESIFWSRSRCPSCKGQLPALDLIPFLSYLSLAGRCRFCKAKISLQYPLVELGTGVIFLFTLKRFSNSSFDLFFWLFFAASLTVIFTWDIKSKRIPRQIVWPLVLGAVLYKTLPSLIQNNVSDWQFIFESLRAGVVTGGAIFLFVLLTKERAMGKGDVPMAFLQGLLLGLPKGLLALGLSFIIGAVVSVFLLVTKRATLKTAIPFTPFLITSLFIILFTS